MNLDYYRAVLLGVVLGMSSLSLIYMVNVALDTKPETLKSQSKFEVIDKYKNCDLIRWADNQLADYKYFLHCPQ